MTTLVAAIFGLTMLAQSQPAAQSQCTFSKLELSAYQAVLRRKSAEYLEQIEGAKGMYREVLEKEMDPTRQAEFRGTLAELDEIPTVEWYVVARDCDLPTKFARRMKDLGITIHRGSASPGFPNGPWSLGQLEWIDRVTARVYVSGSMQGGYYYLKRDRKRWSVLRYQLAWIS